jgi:hypothetical protein
MVAARERFLGRGHYQPLAAALQSLAARHDPGVPGLVADLADGTGYYLAGLLDALPHRHGACKPQRLAGTYRDYTRSGAATVNYRLSLDHADLTALVSMGPSARHITPHALAARINSLPSPFTVTVDLQIRVFQRPRDLSRRAEGD